MVYGRYNYTPKQKPKLPPELRGGKIGHGWYEDAVRDSRIANKEINHGREVDQGCDQTPRKATP